MLEPEIFDIADKMELLAQWLYEHLMDYGIESKVESKGRTNKTSLSKTNVLQDIANSEIVTLQYNWVETYIEMNGEKYALWNEWDHIGQLYLKNEHATAKWNLRRAYKKKREDLTFYNHYIEPLPVLIYAMLHNKMSDLIPEKL